MRYALCLFFIFICNTTKPFIDPAIYYKKIKWYVQEYQLSKYGAPIIGILILSSFYFFKKKTPTRTLPWLYKPTSLAEREDQLKRSFLVVDPETKEAKNIINQTFNYYRAELSPGINKIDLICTEELCQAVRETLRPQDRNKYNIAMNDDLIPEDKKKYYCDAAFIVGTTLFSFVAKNDSSQ